MMCVGKFMAILDVQVVATSLPTIQSALDIPPDQMSWVQTAYLIAEVVAVGPTPGGSRRRPRLYRNRNAIERMSCRLKDFRRVATRYDRSATNFLVAVCCIAAAISYCL
jgi:MFS family permease